MPATFPFKRKGIFAFIDFGSYEVLEFGMYLQEYKPTCPEPNAG